jgi:hypothetical protein
MTSDSAKVSTSGTENGKKMPDWPWLSTPTRLDQFIRRVRQDRAYRQRLAERLFGRSVDAFEANAPAWDNAVLSPEAWPKPRSMGSFR